MKAAKTIISSSTKALHSPFRRTYSLSTGMALHKRRKIFSKASGFVVLASFGIIGLQGLNSQQPVSQPNPSSNSSASSVENPLTSTGNTASGPIPIYTKPSGGATSPTSSVAVERETKSNYATTDPEQADATLVGSISPGSEADTVGSQVEASGDLLSEESVTAPLQQDGPVSSTGGDAIIPGTIETVVDTTSQTIDDVTGALNGLLGN
jgi:hypothetical protein